MTDPTEGDPPESMAASVARTLTDGPQRWLSPKWFYDDLGSVLFDAITRLDEYYPTRRERSILTARADEIAASGADTLIELGSGTSDKTRILLDAFGRTGHLRRFCPLDVSATALDAAAEAIAAAHPGLEVTPVVGDFLHDLDRIPTGGQRLVVFLGGTIGNLTPDEQGDFLSRVADRLGPGDGILLGTDLVKAPDRLIAAYDDAIGVTAAFDRNVLAVLNRSLEADFDLGLWRHESRWDADAERIEMHLVATVDQTVTVAAVGLTIDLVAGESIRTEISCKFRLEGLAPLLTKAGFADVTTWTDDDGDYALSLARVGR